MLNKELIQVNYDSERPTISARDLHEFLEVKTRYNDWFERMCEYGFLENTDYYSFLSNSSGGRPAKEHQLTIDMAKEIAMIQRNERGKIARQYFLQLEKDWNSPDKVIARGLELAHKKIKNLELVNLQQQQMLSEANPKVSYYDLVLQTKDLLSVNQIAKDYGKSARWLNKKLHELKIQYRQGKAWFLYQKYAEQGYTKTRTHTYASNGEQHSRAHMYFTQKGRIFIYDLLRENGILPTIEKKSRKGG